MSGHILDNFLFVALPYVCLFTFLLMTIYRPFINLVLKAPVAMIVLAIVIMASALIPLNRTSELPDYLKKDDGSALLPSLDPRGNLEAWQDAIEVGWEVVEAELGVTRDEVHSAIGAQQKDSWDDFMQSVEERKRKREEQGGSSAD